MCSWDPLTIRVKASFGNDICEQMLILCGFLIVKAMATGKVCLQPTRDVLPFLPPMRNAVSCMRESSEDTRSLICSVILNT